SLSTIYYVRSTDTSTTQIDTLSLHDALPISRNWRGQRRREKQLALLKLRKNGAPGGFQGTLKMNGLNAQQRQSNAPRKDARGARDRKSTRLNSSHVAISYAVFCLKKKREERT